MTKQEIAEMITKYAITDNRDGRIKISNTKGSMAHQDAACYGARNVSVSGSSEV